MTHARTKSECGYCNRTVKEPLVNIATDWGKVPLIISRGALMADFHSDATVANIRLSISFCPMCGKNLEAK